MSFRLDTSHLGELNVLLDGVTILSASARNPHPAVNGSTDLLRLVVFPPGMTLPPSLWAAFAFGSQPGSYCWTNVVQTLVDGDLLRFEVDVGVGSAGALRWWINSDFSDPPTGTAGNLDNAAWLGVQTVALGAFQPFGRAAQNGTTLRFYQIESDDDTLFWNGFEN